MKKIGAFLLTLASCVALVSCGSKNKKEPTTTAPTTTVAPEPAPTPTYTYTSKSVSEVMQNIGSKLKLSVNLPANEEGTYVKQRAELAVSGNKVCISNPEGGVYFKEIEGIKAGTVGMFVDDGMYAYNGVYAVPASTIESYIDFEEALSIACGLNITYDTKVEQFEFINRRCTEYLHSYKENGNDITEEWVIDNATGMCLKHSIIKVEQSGPKEIIDNTTFVVDEFILGDDVDEFFKSEDNRIIIEPCDSKFLGGNGLVTKTVEEKSYFIISDILAEYDEDKTMPTLYLDKSASPYTEGIQYGHETTYILEGTDSVKGDFANFILGKIYNCGAKYNATGSIASIGELTIEYEEEDSICMGYSLQAFTESNARYLVNLEYGTDETMFGSKTTLSISLVDLTTKPKDVYPYSYEYKTKTTEEIIDNLNGTYVMDVKYPIYQDENEKYDLCDVTIAKGTKDMVLITPIQRVYLHEYSETQWHLYNYVEKDSGYSTVELVPKTRFVSEEDLLEIACELDIDFNSIEVNVEFLGRTCTRFINTYKDIDEETIKEEYIVDNITGICLKHEYKKGNNVIVKERSFEVTSITLDSDQVVEYFNGEIASFKVSPWDDKFMEACGFVEKTGEVRKHGYVIENIMDYLGNENIDIDYDLSVAYYNDDGILYGTKDIVTIKAAEGETITDVDKGLFAMNVAMDIGICGINYNASGYETNFAEDYTDSSWDDVYTKLDDSDIINYIQLEGFADSGKNIVVELTYTLDTDGTAEITLEITDTSKDPRN